MVRGAAIYSVANRLPIAPDWQEEFEERFRKRAGEIDKQLGFVRMQILRPDAEGLPNVVLTTWQDQASFESWVGSDDFKIAHQNPLPKEAFTGKPSMEKHLVVINAEKS